MAYYWLSKVKHKFMAHCQQWFYNPWWTSKAPKNMTMVNYDKRDGGGDEDKNKDSKNNGNDASVSGSDDPIFNPITTPRSWIGIAEEDWATTTMALQPRWTMYLRIGIYLPYKNPINAIVKMRHKLLYAKIEILDLCCWNIETVPVEWMIK